MIREYTTKSATVTEIIEDECHNNRVEFHGADGLRTSRKCLFIDYERDNSEIVVHNLTEEELRDIKKIIGEL
ncbi:hypothetical protein HAHI6034_05610 [Hathewaya histolytica]|uniref:Uncharacterized protein n=1 Tax=Hathewaya histolytica TaxID=1498 RepID=A0A4U9RDR1_HATHI|nr:hypothetical protein [Hathewaya histolytica]VTQ89894.1 Uncharacterised protein [Hathewaya histolytica]